MGRVVLGEATTCEPQLEKLYSLTANAQKFGLLIGKLSDENQNLQKDHVVHFAPTPEDEEADGDKPSSKVTWISAHAKQVIRMLPGGLDIIGLFVACPSSNFDQLKTDVQKILIQIDKAASRSILGLKPNSPQEYLVLHICTKTKKTTCRSLSLGDKSATFRPAEWKIQQFISQWSKLHTMCNIDLPYLTSLTAEKQQAYLKIQSGLRSLAEAILESHATINGKMLDDSSLISSLLAPQSSGQSGKGKKALSAVVGGNFCVDLFVDAPKFSETDNSETYMNYSGCVQGLAFIPSKVSIKDALYCLKLDLVRSIVGRFKILYEDVIETSDEPLLGCLLPPKRAVIESDSQTFVDYIFESETEKDVASRLEEILSLPHCEDCVTSSENFPDPEDLEDISMPRARPVMMSVVEEIKSVSSNMKAMTGLAVAGITALASIVIGKLVME